jgi:hypothetical protein
MAPGRAALGRAVTRYQKGSERLWSLWTSRSNLEQDAVLYLLAGVFAAGTLAMAVSADYREWAAMAMGPYSAAAVVAAWASRRRPERKAASTGRLRAITILVLLVVTVVVPLCFELVWRADARSGAHAQPEVAVIERAGDRAAHGRDPYLSSPSTPGISPPSDSKALDATSFFPYLPGMVVFGLPNASSGVRELGDARVALAGTTLVLTAVALLLAAGDRDRRWRTLQMLVVLPTGALPLVTGGDDLPVLALMLLGLVLAARRRPVLAGVVIGLASTMKFTAWGVLVLLALGVRDERGSRATARYLAAAAVVVVPIMAAGVLAGPHAFFVNVVEFPLGLTKVASPAASPLPGQELVVLLPHLKRELTALLFGVAAVIVVWALVRHTPKDPAAVARFTALAIILAVVVAPATRFGYFIYPVNLLVWGSLLRSFQASSQEPPQPELLPDPIPAI